MPNRKIRISKWVLISLFLIIIAMWAVGGAVGWFMSYPLMAVFGGLSIRKLLDMRKGEGK